MLTRMIVKVDWGTAGVCSGCADERCMMPLFLRGDQVASLLFLKGVAAGSRFSRRTQEISNERTRRQTSP